MKTILAALAIPLTVSFLAPTQVRADWNKPHTRSGMGWLEGRALNTMPWLHFHGPLYNYGPYSAPGHVPMFIKNPHIGRYVPAYAPGYYGYEYPTYYPNTIQPYFNAQPMQTLTAPTNLHYSQGEPPMAAPVAEGSRPASEQSVVAPQATSAPTYSSRPGLFRGVGFRR